jgi:hypothetical protein
MQKTHPTINSVKKVEGKVFEGRADFLSGQGGP